MTYKLGDGENTTQIAKYKYSYDSNGNITEVWDGNNKIAKYQYDSLNQLKVAWDYQQLLKFYYNYDNSGNIESSTYQSLTAGYEDYVTGNPHSANYYYRDSDWGDLLTEYKGTTLSYDNIGNPTIYRDGMEMTWSGRDLTSITKSGDTYSYTYNINGYRTKKIADGNTYYYYYDSDNKLIGMQTGAHTYVFYYDNEGKIHSMEENGDYYYFVKNAEGDVIAITNHHGTPIVKYTYDAWGKTTSVKDNNGQDISTTSYYAKTIPFRFRGYAYDNESGLYYLNSRYYDPETGRFINADSYVDTESGTPSSTNMFAYCENNPVMGYDPEGTWDRSVHRSMSKENGFDGDKYLLARKINFATDYYPLASNKYYSAPFHSRKESVKIATYLFNQAVRIKFNKEKRKYSFSGDTKNKIKKLCAHLKYTYKSGNKSKTTNAQQKFKKLINYKYKTFVFDPDYEWYAVKLTNKNDKKTYIIQSRILLGLALHTFQDYYSHVIDVHSKDIKVDSAMEYNISELNKWHFITTFNSYFTTPTKELEDNDKVFAWRYDHAKDLTDKLAGLYKSNNIISSATISHDIPKNVDNSDYSYSGDFYTDETKKHTIPITLNLEAKYSKIIISGQKLKKTKEK